MAAPGADVRQLGIALDRDPPGLVVGQVEVEPIELAPRRQVDDPLDVGCREELAGEVDMDPAPLVRRAVDDPHPFGDLSRRSWASVTKPCRNPPVSLAVDRHLGAGVVDRQLVVPGRHRARRRPTPTRRRHRCRRRRPAPTGRPDRAAVRRGRRPARHRRRRPNPIAAAPPIAAQPRCGARPAHRRGRSPPATARARGRRRCRAPTRRCSRVGPAVGSGPVIGSTWTSIVEPSSSTTNALAGPSLA